MQDFLPLTSKTIPGTPETYFVHPIGPSEFMYLESV